MELKETDYIIGCWILDNPEVNILITIKKDGSCWAGEVRFRYPDDRKTFFQFQTKEVSEEKAKEGGDTLAGKMAVESKLELRYVEIKGGPEKFAFKMAQLDQVQVYDAEQYFSEKSHSAVTLPKSMRFRK